MDWAPGDSWSLDMALPGGEYDFKFVVQRQDGSAGDWEPGANRTIKVTFPNWRLGRNPHLAWPSESTRDLDASLPVTLPPDPCLPHALPDI